MPPLRKGSGRSPEFRHAGTKKSKPSLNGEGGKCARSGGATKTPKRRKDKKAPRSRTWLTQWASSTTILARCPRNSRKSKLRRSASDMATCGEFVKVHAQSRKGREKGGEAGRREQSITRTIGRLPQHPAPYNPHSSTSSRLLGGHVKQLDFRAAASFGEFAKLPVNIRLLPV